MLQHLRNQTWLRIPGTLADADIDQLISDVQMTMGRDHLVDDMIEISKGKSIANSALDNSIPEGKPLNSPEVSPKSRSESTVKKEGFTDKNGGSYF